MLLLDRPPTVGFYEPLVSNEVTTVIHDETSNVFLLTERDLLHKEAVEVTQGEVYPHHSHHPIKRSVQSCSPERGTAFLFRTIYCLLLVGLFIVRPS